MSFSPPFFYNFPPYSHGIKKKSNFLAPGHIVFFTYHGFEDNLAVFLISRFAPFLASRFVIGDISHMTLFLVTMVAFDGTIVHGFFDLKKITRTNTFPFLRENMDAEDNGL